jgi:hypothetical protein
MQSLFQGARVPAAVLAAVLVGALLAGCANVVLPPLKTGWYDGSVVHYITTESSDPVVARAQGVTWAPRLAHSLLSDAARASGQRSALDKVYAVTNAVQPSVFASAPSPVGPTSNDTSYTPLWQMVTVQWRPGHKPRELRSQEQVLAAQQAGEVVLQVTDVVLNCPILQR